MWLFIAAGLVFIIIGIPLILRKVPPNPVYGLRVPAACRDEWVWYEANAKSGRDLLILGLAIVLVSVGLRVANVSSGTSDVVFTFALLVGVVMLAAVGWLRANRLAATKDEDRQASEERPNWPQQRPAGLRSSRR